jgi:hypothetical protein
MTKYFLGFDPYRLKNSFGYVIKDSLSSYFDRHNISYTYDVDDDFEEAIVPSGIEFFSYYAKLHKKGVIVNVIATSNMSDFQFKRTKKGPELTLSLDAINYYRRADRLLIFFPSQKKLIQERNIETPIMMMPALTNDFTSSLDEYQRNAFLRYYRLQGNRDIIVSYGILTSKETVMDLRAIARNSPEKDFLFFGSIAPDAMKQTTFESITQPTNIQFHKHLPEELYPSFLANTSRLLMVGDYLCFPQIMIDCINHDIPLITYKMEGFEEILNEKDACITKLYSSLYNTLNSPKDETKTQNAKQTIERLKESALNTDIEKTTIL